jgi:hypothetical protein
VCAYRHDNLLRLDGLTEEIDALGPATGLHAGVVAGGTEEARLAELIQLFDKLEHGVS